MSTAAIIVIAIVVVLVVLGVAFAVPRMGMLRRERELRQRRQHVSAEHRQEAEVREQRADEAQRRAEIAAQEARREREEAQLHEERAALHEQGLADHELVDEDERERFAGTTADPAHSNPAPIGEQWEGDPSRDPNHHGMDRPSSRRSKRM